MADFSGKIVDHRWRPRSRAAHTELFAESGATVHALDDLGTALAADLTGRGHDVRYAHQDVTDEVAWAALAKDLDDQHGAVDVLINNAGIVHTCDIPDETLDRFEKTLRVNTTGVFLGMRTLWPLLPLAAPSSTSPRSAASTQQPRLPRLHREQSSRRGATADVNDHVRGRPCRST